MAAGCETACRISYGITEDLAKYGWYMPPIITSFGATAAVGKIMGLTREELVAAFSFNLCQTTCSSKILTDPDSAMRSVREAFAAKNAIISCYMAKRGLKDLLIPLGREGILRSLRQKQHRCGARGAGLGKASKWRS